MKDEMKEKMPKHIVTKEKFLFVQVCSAGSYEEAEAWIRMERPAGTSNNWSKTRDKKLKPVKCEDYPKRKHYVFIC